METCLPLLHKQAIGVCFGGEERAWWSVEGNLTCCPWVFRGLEERVRWEGSESQRSVSNPSTRSGVGTTIRAGRGW